MVAGALSWPHWIVRVLTLVLILGVPVVALLAWYHGQQQLKRVTGPELIMISLLGVIAGSVLWAFSGTGEEHTTAQTPAIEKSATTPTAAEPTPSTPPAPRTAVAVLPFANLTGDASKEYLGDGMAEELINTLAKVQGLKVPARTSSFAYKGRNVNIRDIAKDLQVGTILEGSVRAAGKRIRITAQLINAQDGLHLWSETYDEEFTDIFKLQDKLANAIALALEPKLADVGASPVTPTLPTQDVEAYNLYLQAWSLAHLGGTPNNQRAVDLFKQAVARDPKFARAYAGMGEAYMGLGTNATTDAEADRIYAAAAQAARNALALDPTLPEPHNSLAGIAQNHGYYLEFASHTEAALHLGGDDGWTRAVAAINIGAVGHNKEAVAEGKRAYALAPANPIVLSFYAAALSRAGETKDAVAIADRAVALGFNPNGYPMTEIYSSAALTRRDVARMRELQLMTFAASGSRQAEIEALSAPAFAALAAATTSTAQRSASAPDKARLISLGRLACEYVALVHGAAGLMDAAYGAMDACLELTQSDISRPLVLFAPELRAFRKDARFHGLATRLGMMEYFERYGPPDDCELKNNRLTCH
jgi:TolB-like protein/Tfp pilus assembly protein PilF